jgi:hypothetical protein
MRLFIISKYKKKSEFIFIGGMRRIRREKISIDSSFFAIN